MTNQNTRSQIIADSIANLSPDSLLPVIWALVLSGYLGPMETVEPDHVRLATRDQVVWG